MGEIQKQSIKGTIFIYIGVLIGFITQGLILPNVLSTEQNGVLDLLNSWALIFATLANLGFNQVTYRLFPYFRDAGKKHHGFFVILLSIIIIGFLIASLCFQLLKPLIIKDSIETSALFIQYIDFVFPLMFFYLVFISFDVYYTSLYNAFKGIFYKEFMQRIFILIAILLFFLLFKNKFSLLIILYIGALSLPSLLISLALIRDGEFHLRPEKGFVDKKMRQSMLSVAFYGILVAFSSNIIQYVDRIMINSLIGLEDTGIYGRAFFFGVLVIVPNRIIKKISSVYIANAWKSKDLKTIKDIYFKTTLNQLIIGLLVFIGIWGNIDNIMAILPNEYASGQMVIFFIGLANLIVMAGGVNGEIISTSSYYRVSTLFIVIFGLLVIISNYFFINWFGIKGAAMASALATFFYALLRYFFLLIKYKMQPYSYRHLLSLIFGIAAYFISQLLPDVTLGQSISILGILDVSTIIDIILRSLIILISYLSLILIFNISEDYNQKMKEYWSLLKKRINR